MKKFDKVLKEKFLYTKKKNIFKILYFIYHKYFSHNKKFKKSYSYGGLDLLLNHLYRNHTTGVYVDVGCHHPLEGNNTYLLHKKGWEGINIDLDPYSIETFNFFRPKDFNINSAVADKKKLVDLFFYHHRSPINTINTFIHKSRIKKSSQIKKIETNTLDNIIEESPYKDRKINLLSIDVEGSEMDILKGFNLRKYCPDVVVIEFLDLSMKKLEFYNQSINKVIKSDLYEHMTDNNYHLVNWLHSDLVFVNNNFRD